MRDPGKHMEPEPQPLGPSNRQRAEIPAGSASAKPRDPFEALIHHYMPPVKPKSSVESEGGSIDYWYGGF